MLFCFYKVTPTTEISSLSLHDALPISRVRQPGRPVDRDLRLGRRRQLHRREPAEKGVGERLSGVGSERSEEHTSELQSLRHLVCRLLLEKKNEVARLRDRRVSTKPAVV